MEPLEAALPQPIRFGGNPNSDLIGWERYFPWWISQQYPDYNRLFYDQIGVRKPMDVHCPSSNLFTTDSAHTLMVKFKTVSKNR